ASVYWGNSKTVQFYGQVVDQNRKPIAGAQVSLAVSGFNPAALTGGEEYLKEQSITCTTDAAGKFVVQGISGIALNIKRISQPNYLAIPEPRWDTPKYEALSYRYARDRGVPYYIPESTKPAIFPLRKEGEK